MESGISSHGYTGTALAFIDHEVMCYASGSGLVFTNVKEGLQQHCLKEGNGVSAFAVCQSLGVFAISDHNIDPTIQVHDYHTFNKVAELEGGAELKYSALGFSACGRFLVALGEVPGLKLTVWDWEHKEVVASTVVQESHLGNGLSFFPGEGLGTMFCVAGPRAVRVFMLEKTMTSWKLAHQDVDLQEHLQLETDRSGEDGETQEGPAEVAVNCFCWLPDGKLALGTSNDLLLTCAPFAVEEEPTTPHAETVGLLSKVHVTYFRDKHGIAALTITREHLIVVSGGGEVLWMDYDGQQTFCSSSTRAAGVVCAHLNSSFDIIAVGTSTGVVTLLNIRTDKASAPASLLGSEDMQVEVSDLCNCHVGEVSDMVPISGGKVVSGGRDGTLRMWSYSDDEGLMLMARRGLHRPVTALASYMKGTSGMLALGTTEGAVQILDPETLFIGPSFQKPIFSASVHSGEVVQLLFCPFCNYLASRGSENRVFFLDARGGHVGVTPLGYVDAPKGAQIHTMAWTQAPKGDLQLVLSCGHGDLYFLTPPAIGTKPADTYEVDPDQLNMWLIRVQAPVCGLYFTQLQAGMGGGTHHMVAHAADRKIRKYKVRVAEMEPVTLARPPTDTFLAADLQRASHAKRGSILVLSADKKFFATGSDAGDVVVNTLVDMNELLRKNLLNAAHGVASMCFLSPERLLVAGRDGGIHSIRVFNPGEGHVHITPKDSNLQRDPPPPKHLDKPQNLMEKREKERHESQQEQREAANRSMVSQLEKIRKKFRTALLRNDKVPEMEKLNAKEFVVEFELRDELIADGEYQIATLQESNRQLNLKTDLLAERVKMMCYNEMQMRGLKITGFETSTTVSNFPMRVLPGHEATKLRKVTFLRRVERNERILRAKDELSVMTQIAMDQVSVANSTSEGEIDPDVPPATPAADAGEDEEDEGDNTGGGDELGAVNGTDHLYYHAFELYTPGRRITQIVLLQSEIRKLSMSFNTKVNAALDRKYSDLEKATEKQERMLEILQELKSEETVKYLKMAATEQPEDVLVVKDSEVTAEKVLTAEERRVKEEKERYEREQAELAAKDDTFIRALKDMFDGTLEKKKTGVLEELAREPWMDQPRELLTQDQIRELTEFEARVKVYEEEMGKLRKALETEFRQIQTEVEAVCKAFDMHLLELFHEKMRTDQQVYVWELMCVRLARSLADLKDTEQEMATNTQELNLLKMTKAKKQTALSDLKKEVDKRKAFHDSLAAEDKALDKGFRKEFGEFTEHYDHLLKVFRYRKGGKAAAQPPATPLKGKKGKSDAENRPSAFQRIPPSEANPYVAVEKDVAVVEDQMGDPTVEKPEHLEVFIWERVLEYRETKLGKEAELREDGAVLAEINKELAAQVAEDEAQGGRIERILRKLQELQLTHTQLSRDLDMYFELKQGQVEVEQAAVVTDYSDTGFINRLHIEKLNAEIKEKGGEKVTILHQLKDNRKDMYRLEWENERHELMVEDLKSKIKELQLLRVTKELQATLRDEEGTQTQQEELRLQSRLQAMDVVHAEQMQTQARNMKKMDAMVKDKQLENELLVEKTAAATLLLEERKKMSELRSQAQEPQILENTRMHKMRNIMTNRKLKEIAKAQVDEMRFLTAELNGLQKRSFPSFSKQLRRPLLNADIVLPKNFTS
ncbi:hypothetical protein CYMTET_38257 [Cymbomonas tetramitiformis]|uniref:Cilia- and flagella-associated protein 43 n=1 Tax=Cymbomonas tetramitiformis TaxID=36881 RepID=A0AAE0CEG2_9CHLO|nr:hypothetical protein CYMTET_38257 [Cymbomonas tetramitiformis]